MRIFKQKQWNCNNRLYLETIDERISAAIES